MAAPHPADGSHTENRRVRMEDGLVREDPQVEARAQGDVAVDDADAEGHADTDDTSSSASAASSARSEDPADSSDEESDRHGHTSSRSRRSSASRWSMSRRSSPPPELPVSPLIPSRRQSSNAGALTHEERMTLGMRRSSSRASRTSRTSRVSRASGGGVVSFEDDDRDDMSGDGSDGDGDDEEDVDVDVQPLSLGRAEVAESSMASVPSAAADEQPTTDNPDITATIPSPFPRPTTLRDRIDETSPLLPQEPNATSPALPSPAASNEVGDEVADAGTLFEQSLMAGAWSAFRRTEEGRGVATGTRRMSQDETSAPAVPVDTPPTTAEIQPVEPVVVRREITYCEPAPSPASTLQQDLYNLFLQPKYLTLRCGASAPSRVFTRGCATPLTLFGVSLTLPNAPSHMAAWRTLIPVPMIWHKPAGTQTQWFATKEVPERVVKLLASPGADDGYEMRRVGMREPGGGRDCYVLACACCGNKLGFYFSNPPEAFKGYHWLFLPSLVTALKEDARDDHNISRKIRPTARSRQRTDPMEFLMPLDPKEACPDWVKTENRRHMHTPRMTPRSWQAPVAHSSSQAGQSMGVPSLRSWPRISYDPNREVPQDQAGESSTSEVRRGRSGFSAEAATARPRADMADSSQRSAELFARFEYFERLGRETQAETPRLVTTLPEEPRFARLVAAPSSPQEMMLRGRPDRENLRSTTRASRGVAASSPLSRQARIASAEDLTAVAATAQTARRATGVGNGVEMRQVLIDGRMMDVVVIGESDAQAGPSSGGAGGQPALAAGDAALDCPPDGQEDSRAWLANFNATRADLIRSANAWQAIRDAENDADARIDEEDEDESDDDWQTRVGEDGLDAVSERSGEDDTHDDDDDEDSEVSEEGTESGEEVNDDGGIPMRGWSMLDVDAQRERSRSRSRSRSRADSPARGRESFSRNTHLRGSLRHPSASRSRSRVRMASPSPTPSAAYMRRAEETEREEARVDAWRYWRQLADEWQSTEPPLLPLVEGRGPAREPGSGLRSQSPGVIDPELLVY